jgi:hypothetical protein
MPPVGKQERCIGNDLEDIPRRVVERFIHWFGTLSPQVAKGESP